MTNHRDTARAAVRERLAALKLDPNALARAADVDADTVNDFLEGRRWSRLSTLAKLDDALGWPPGAIDRISRGGDTPYSSPVEEHLSGVLLDLADGAYAHWVAIRNAESVSATAASTGLAGYSSGALLAELERRLTGIGPTGRSDLPDDLDTGALPQPSAKGIGAEQVARPWASHNRSDATRRTGTRSGDDTPASTTP